MAGVRLHHSSLASCTVAVEAVRSYKQPFACPLCAVTHQFKTVHLTLDNSGDVIVSKQVWLELKDLPGLPLEAMNDVKKPPALVLSMNGGVQAVEVTHVPFEGRR